MIDPETGDWDAFDADVNISFFGQSAGTSLPDPSRAVGYHVHRYLASEGTWQANYGHSNYRAVVSGAPGDMDPPRVTNAYGAGGSVTPTFYDANGSRIFLEEPAIQRPTGTADYAPAPSTTGPQVPPPPGGMYARVRTNDGTLANAGSPASGLGPGANASNSTKGWLDRYVVTPAAARRTRESLARIAASSQKHAGGTERFTISRGPERLEIEIDSARGVVREMRVVVDGKLQSVTTREYEPQKFGQVLRRERIVRTLADGSSRAFEVAYSNITLSKGK